MEKVYILKTTDDPAAIPTGSFEREGCRYTLLDLLREDHSETETREHTETVSTSSDTKDMSVILQKLDAAMELETEDGYSGTLTLDPKSITVEAAGYQSSSRTISATRTFPNLSTADVSLVPKTAQENGRTLTLADVSWQTVAGAGPEAPTLFTATATYTGTATSSYATGYKISASYTGTLTHTTNDTVIYTAVFTGAPSKPAVSAAPAEPFKPPVSDPAPTFDILPVALGAALVLVAGGAVLDGGAVDPGAGFVVEGSTGFFPSTAFTDVTSDLYYSGGHLGTLNIPAIGLSVKIYEGTGSSPLSKGAGHFEDTSIWDGNVALAGHNRG